MAATKIDLKLLVSVIGLVVAIEYAGLLISMVTAISPLLRLGAVRTVEILVVSLLLMLQSGDTLLTDGGKVFLTIGIARGALWSMVLAIMAVIAFFLLSALGMNPLSMIRQPLPHAGLKIAGYFLVGAVLSPVAEELVFRGVIYAAFRKWGFLPALLFSTVLFVLAHKTGYSAIPVPQILGGVIFALSYELEKNLMVPITIHISGNFALFSISLL
ncbi:MAG: type II CAAX endopeptidase family protein [Pseudomonadota bacterium]